MFRLGGASSHRSAQRIVGTTSSISSGLFATTAATTGSCSFTYTSTVRTTSYRYASSTTTSSGSQAPRFGQPSASDKNASADDSNNNNFSTASHTGADNLVATAEELKSEVETILAAHRAKNPHETLILTFNAIRRLHMHERDATARKHLEAQAWRTIQKVSEKDIDGCTDIGVAIVVSAWAYFARYWENGRRGPVVPSHGLEPSPADEEAFLRNFPPSNDITVKIDHSAALLHETDLLTHDDKADDDMEDMVTSGGDGSNNNNNIASTADEPASVDTTLDDDVTDGTRPTTQKRHPTLDRGGNHRNYSSSGNNNADGGSSNNPSSNNFNNNPQRRTLRKKTAPTQSETVEAPRTEVLDEVFE